MKKKLFVLFLAFAMVFAFAACGGGGGESGGDEGTGSVYWLNMKPEADEALQGLAAAYTEETGVPVKVVTAASGSYGDTQNAEMAKSEPPTLFNVGNMSALRDWEDYCLTLDGTDVMNEQTTAEFNLVNDAGETKALGWAYESYGIIVNKALLEQAGHSLDEIKDFDSLKAVADDIHARAGELGFDAFSSAGLDDSSSWRFTGHLENMPLFYEFRDDGIIEKPASIKGTYMDNYKKIWDLYITDSAGDKTSLASSTINESRAEFGEGKAVFYQNGTWEWAALTVDEFTMNPDDITMIPIYCGVDGEENAGLCSGCENCWAVNSQVSEADQQATLDFLKWCVTTDKGLEVLSSIGALPFKAAPASDNGFINAGSELLANGKYAVSWAFNYTPNVDSFRATLKTALATYAADPSDANWDGVVKAFVDGWAYEYGVENN